MSNTLNDKKINVFLDLDNTIINSLSLKDEIKLITKAYQNSFKYTDMPRYYRIFHRPHLQEFLDYIFDRFNVSVFTAADTSYACFIIKNIILSKPGRNLKYIFTGDHSAMSEKLYNSPKDLRLLWTVFNIRDLSPKNTIIIDDLPDVKDANPYNCIRVKAFDLLENDNTPSQDYMNEMINDNTLKDVMIKLEDVYSKLRDNYSI